MYADILFLVNFSMDYLALYITGKILHRRMTLARTLIASAAGGIYGVAAVAFGIAGASQIISGIIISALMCAISFPIKKYIDEIKIYAVFWCISAVLGGIMTAIYSFLNSNIGDITSVSEGSITKTNDKIGFGRLVGLAVIAGIIVISLIKLFTASPAASGKSVSLTILLNKKSVNFEALADSGNLLTDPVSGRSVVIVSAEAARGLFDEKTYEILKSGDVAKLPEIDRSIRNKIRLIPKNTLNEKKILLGFVPDSLIITHGNESKQRDAVIALADTSKNHFGGLAATIPTAILR